MALNPVDGTGAYRWTPPDITSLLTPAPIPTPFAPLSGYRPEPSYHPQVSQVSSSTANPGGSPQNPGNPYSLPPGSTLGQTASGQQAQPFDVTLSQLATAVYTTRGGPPAGWDVVGDPDLQARGITDTAAWRQQFLGGGEQTTAQEFRAEVYTDGNGSYVLSYRGTAEGAADWDNNFRQGAGFTTDDNGDKFSGTAANTAVEFERVFGNNPTGESTNLAMTGHSQGGGLATVGSLASGVPAVTFDASGIHPNTWDRMGIDPQRARDIAEDGQIRAYSLQADLLTQAQESGPLGLLAPDALGTSIVVRPASADANNMFNNYGPLELEGKSPEELARINGLVEAGRHTPFLPLTPLTGLLTGGAILGGNLAYSAISHSPNALTAGMVEHQPWQPGYENPSDFGKGLQDLVPDPLKDDYARNTHDLINDIAGVVNTDFASGNYVQGGFRIAGDLAEGFFNSAGDTLDTGIDALGGGANTLIDGAGSLADRGIDAFGGFTQGAFNLTGDVANGGFDQLGNGAQTLGNFGGQTIRGLGNVVGLPGVGDAAGDFIEGAGAVVNQGADAFGRGFEIGADALGTAANATIDFFGDGVEAGADVLGDAASASIDFFGDGIELGTDALGTAAEATADFTGTVGQGLTDGARAAGDFLNPFN